MIRPLRNRNFSPLGYHFLSTIEDDLGATGEDMEGFVLVSVPVVGRVVEGFPGGLGGGDVVFGGGGGVEGEVRRAVFGDDGVGGGGGGAGEGVEEEGECHFEVDFGFDGMVEQERWAFEGNGGRLILYNALAMRTPMIAELASMCTAANVRIQVLGQLLRPGLIDLEGSDWPRRNVVVAS